MEGVAWLYLLCWQALHHSNSCCVLTGLPASAHRVQCVLHGVCFCWHTCSPTSPTLAAQVPAAILSVVALAVVCGVAAAVGSACIQAWAGFRQVGQQHTPQTVLLLATGVHSTGMRPGGCITSSGIFDISAFSYLDAQ